MQARYNTIGTGFMKQLNETSKKPKELFVQSSQTATFSHCQLLTAKLKNLSGMKLKFSIGIFRYDSYIGSSVAVVHPREY